MKKIIIKISLGCLFVLSFSPLFLYANSSQQQGESIMIEVEKRDEGFGDFSGSVKMMLKDRDGEKALRYFRVHNLEVSNDGDKRLLVFDKPRDIARTALLTYSHSLTNDDQWLFMPAINRVKRISSNNKSGPFVGSEFAYEDLSSQEYEKYGEYRLLGEENVNGVDCFKVERVPLYKHSGYSKQVVWIDKQQYRYQKISYYDKAGIHYKELELLNYEKFLDKYWRATSMIMKNKQTGKMTTLTWENIEFQTGIRESLFTKTALKRAR